MAKSMRNEFIPDFAPPPGATLLDLLEQHSMTQKELALRLGMNKVTVNRIISGEDPLTQETALKLEKVFAAPAQFWLNREQQFRITLARLNEQGKLKRNIEWLARIPVNELRKRGHITEARDKVAISRQALSFFGVASSEEWEAVYGEGGEYLCAARQSHAVPKDIGAVAAWMRVAEIRAAQAPCSAYDPAAFRDALNRVRDLTMAPAQIMQDQLPKICHSAGVRVQFVKEFPRTGLSGLTRWLGKNPLIQLNLRYKTHDQLWFTFFHEAAHILKHGRKLIFLDKEPAAGDSKDELEREADRFARDILIPPAAYAAFLGRGPRIYGSARGVHAFAREINIDSGIVVGRLQHDGKIPFKNLNGLKRKVDWGE